MRQSLMTIRHGECRWPVGEELRGDEFYCGDPAQVGKQYCAEHCRIAYRERR